MYYHSVPTHLRLDEFNDPEPYSLSADDATDFLKQLERNGHTRSWHSSSGSRGSRRTSKGSYPTRYGRVSKSSPLVVISAPLTIAQSRLRLHSLFAPNFLALAAEWAA